MDVLSHLRNCVWPYLGATESTRSNVWLIFRSVAHVLLGAVMACVFWLLILGGFPAMETKISATGFWVAIVIIKEMIERKNQPWYKTMLDILSNLAGFSVVMWLA